MDMYELKWTRLQNEIFRFLSAKSGSFLNQREIAAALHVSPTAVSKAVIGLEKEGLIKINKSPRMNLTLIGFNRDSQKAVELKRAENLKMIYESGVVDFLEDIFPGSVIVLFGSYSYGEDTEKSDIDIAVIGADEKGADLERFENLFGKEININFYKSLKEIHKNLLSNILNGIVLVGRISI